MTIFLRLILSFTLFFIVSCSSKKDVIYLQDIDSSYSFNNNFIEYTLKKGDILKVSIITESPFEPGLINNQQLNYNQTRESLMFDGYVVDNDGNINLPQLGQVYVLDKSVKIIESEISSLIQELDILTSPVVIVKVLSWDFTVMGEVKNPGKYFFNESDLNLIEALGMAGDLTINGKRDGIKLIRKSGDKMIVKSIDLTNSNFINEGNFQIFPDDIIIVNPNSNRVKNAGIIGNSGTLLSLLSFLLSSIIVINR